jgi:hypothetical protein
MQCGVADSRLLHPSMTKNGLASVPANLFYRDSDCRITAQLNEETMTTQYLLDFGKCSKGHLTPLQPSTPPSVDDYQKSIETGGDPLLAVCIRCSRVYRVRSLHRNQSTQGLFPDDPTSPLRVFEESIECEGEAHTAPLTVRGVRNENTKVADLKRGWRWDEGEDTKCPWGDEILFPQFVGG